MTDDLLEDQEVEEPQEVPQPPVGRSVEDLLAENERLRRKERELLNEVKTVRAQEREALKRDFPWLTDDDLKGQNPRFLRTLLSKAPITPPGVSQGQEQAREDVAPEVEEGKKFASFDAGQAKQSAPEKLSALAAHKKYESGEWTAGEYANWRQQTYGQ